MIKERKEREERQTKILNTMKAVQKSYRTHVLNGSICNSTRTWIARKSFCLDDDNAIP
jgi:predicted restriction endonuclease